MSVLAEIGSEPVFDEASFPTSVDAQAAQEAVAALRVLISASKPIEMKVGDGGREQSVRIPLSAARLLTVILDETSRGHAVSIVPVHAELTTQEAADMLNVSRPTLIDMLEAGELPYHRVRKHRRIRAEDLIQFKRKMHADAYAALDRMVAYDQELGI